MYLDSVDFLSSISSLVDISLDRLELDLFNEQTLHISWHPGVRILLFSHTSVRLLLRLIREQVMPVSGIS